LSSPWTTTLVEPKSLQSCANNKIEKILNKRKFREKDRYLVQWQGYTAEKDTWEPRENLENAQDLVDKFEEEYREGVRQIKKRNSREDYKWELLGRYTAKMLYR